MGYVSFREGNSFYNERRPGVQLCNMLQPVVFLVGLSHRRQGGAKNGNPPPLAPLLTPIFCKLFTHLSDAGNLGRTSILDFYP